MTVEEFIGYLSDCYGETKIKVSVNGEEFDIAGVELAELEDTAYIQLEE